MTKHILYIDNPLDEAKEITKKHILKIGGIIQNEEPFSIKWLFPDKKADVDYYTNFKLENGKTSIKTIAVRLDDNLEGEVKQLQQFHSLILEDKKTKSKETKVTVENETLKRKAIKEERKKNVQSKVGFEKWIVGGLIGITIISFLIFSLSNDGNSSKNVFITEYGYYGAYTKEDFNRYVRYSNDGDMEAVKQLLYSAKITPIPGGREAHLIKSNFSTVKIRLKGQTTEIWTFTEAINFK